MLALICGLGALPAAVAAAQEDMPLICALSGFEPDSLTPDMTFRIERLGSTLVALGARGVTDVCLCGAIRRPPIDPAQIDADTAPLVPILQQAIAAGDDGALRAVMGIFEQTGFKVHGAAELAPDLLPNAGVPTNIKPSANVAQSLPAAQAALKDMGAADLGQACVVNKGRVIALENDAGTDAMLNALAPEYDGTWAYRDPFTWAVNAASDALDTAVEWLAGDETSKEPALLVKGGFLFKAPKPGQDRRADLPTIGPQTVMNAAAAGLAGIVIEADGVMVLDLPRVVGTLNAFDMFLWVRAP